MENIEQFLEEITTIKAGNFDVKIPTAAISYLAMFGGMDKYLGRNLKVKDRFELIEQIKDITGSEASFSNAKQPKLDINNIKSEFHRLLWKKHVCPIYTMKMYEYYESAILSMETYTSAKKESAKRAGIVYTKEPLQGHQVWIFKNWSSCTQTNMLDFIVKINSDEYQKQKIAVGFVCLLDKFTVKPNEKYGDMCDVVFDDGQGYFNGMVWSDKRTKKTPLGILTAIKSNVGKPCIVIGKVSKRGPYTSFTVWDIQELLV